MRDKEKEHTPATGVVGTVLGGVALAGLLGQNGGGGGILGGLFGGNGFAGPRHCGAHHGDGEVRAFELAEYTKGQRAITELDVVTKYFMPLMSEVCDLKARGLAAETAAPLRDALLRSQFSGEIYQSTCHCIKGQDMILPNQMAAPYHGGQTILAAYPSYPCPPFYGGRNEGRGEERREERCEGRRGFYPDGAGCCGGNWR